jgi:hypothetical protein
MKENGNGKFNLRFKLAIIERFGTASALAKKAGLRNARLSGMVHGEIYPSPSERAKLLTVFTERELGRFFPSVLVKPKAVVSKAVVNE